MKTYLPLIFVLLLVVSSARAADAPASTEVLVERRQTVQKEMQRLDAMFLLIPFQYRAEQQKLTDIDAELARRAKPEATKP